MAMMVTRALAAPASVAAAVVAAGVVLYVRDPATSSYIPCPFHALTGLWCPGCGTTRAAGDLVRGDVSAALSSNVLAVLLFGIGVAAWMLWVGARVRGRPLGFGRPPLWFVVTGLVVSAAFTIVRNLPVGNMLAP
nr:DUF2752 domain-containing protein [Rhodococcus sp. (in: high G+C Gram-positive bacteria)]